MNLRVNLVCVLGAALGIASLLSPWIVYHQTDLWAVVVSKPSSGFDLLIGSGPYDPRVGGGFVTDKSIISVSILLFAAGTAFAFFSPLGGILQIAGAWYISSWPLFDLPKLWFGSYYRQGIGLSIGLLAGAVSLLSILIPIGLHYRDRPVSMVGRLFSINRIK